MTTRGLDDLEVVLTRAHEGWTRGPFRSLMWNSWFIYPHSVDEMDGTIRVWYEVVRAGSDVTTLAPSLLAAQRAAREQDWRRRAFGLSDV